MATTKNEIKVWIDDVEYSEFVDLPVSITDKNLEESLNLITLNLKKTQINSPFSPIQRGLVQVLSGGTLEDEFKYLLLNDRTQKLGYNNLYNHSLTFIESTHILSTVPMPNKTVTRITGVYEPTLYTALLNVIGIANNSVDYAISISSELVSKLNSIPSPEWTFTGRTVLEVVRMILSLAKLVPFVEWVSDTSFTLTYVDMPRNVTSQLDNFFLSEGTYDPRTYTTSLYSDVSNFLAGEDKPITEPANGWLTPRSPEGFTVSADTLEFRTKYPIYKIIDSDLIKYLRVDYSYDFNSAIAVIPLSLIPQEYFIENTESFIFERDYWESLLNTEDYLEKGGSFFYEQGTSRIQNLQYQAPTWSNFFDASAQAWKIILDNYYQGTSGAEITHTIKIEYAAEVETIVTNYILDLENGTEDKLILNYYRNYPIDTNVGFDLVSNVKPWQLKMKLTYVPLIDNQIFTYKETRPEDRFRTYRSYNQQANVISNEVLGELHEKVLRRGNGDSMNMSIVRDRYALQADTGDTTGDYIITTKEIEVNLYTTKTTYTLNKYFTQLKKYAAILEEYRQYAIPNENIVRSQQTIHGFAKINTLSSLPTGQTSDSYYDLSQYVSQNEINLFKMTVHNIALPAVSYNLNNTLIFDAEFESNAVAGYGIEQTTNADYYKQVPVKYTDENGMIGTTLNLSFGKDFPTFTELMSQELPSYTGGLENTFYSETVNLSKDAREQLAISLQLHHIVENDDIHLNDGFSRVNGLIGGKGLNSADFKVAFLNIKPNNRKYLEAAEINSTENVGWYYDADMVYLSSDVNSGIPSLSWAIIDTTNNNEILMWVDEFVDSTASNSNIVITFHNDY